jgi:subtilisin family serine protease
MIGSRLTRALGFALLLLAGLAPPAHAAWMWDQDADKIDDRMAQVEAGGPLAARVGGLATGRLRFALMNAAAPFEYGVYVGYDHHPTDADANALAALGVPVQVRYRSIDYIRSRVTLAQAQAIAALPGVTRIETIPIFYAVNDVATQALRARGSGGAYFPSVWGHLGVTGRGVTVAILDTGVNDAADASSGYPGHESLRDKWVGGGSFFAGDPLLNTPIGQSINPAHTLDPEATYHGTHVAGTAVGSGGPNGVGAPAPGFYAGLAPEARLVDMKVLSDAGAGFGSADALDWLIANRFNTWGLTGADSIYKGVDVANLSLGGSDASDGTDANSAAVNAAVRANILVCVASGNDGNTAFMVSPGAADLALTVGSFTDNNTVGRADDIVADYSNEGPRLDDGDADHEDEMKPNVLGPGTGILSALGDPTTDGRQYHHINGTSMACPAVAGVAALVRSANPGLTALEVRRLLMDTSDHRTAGGKQPPSSVDPFDVDPNYHPSWGWGEVDAFAAVKEAIHPLTTQVTRLEVIPQRGPDGFQVKWTAQREIGLDRYFIERAPDVAGGPGAWTAVHLDLPAVPRIRLQREGNRTVYTFTDTDPALVPSARYWYRVRWTDVNEGAPTALYGSGTSVSFGHPEPALSGRIMDSPVVAQVRYSWTHDYSDGDLAVRFGTGTSTASPVWDRPGLGAPAADSVLVRLGDPFTGTLQHYFHVDLTADDLVASYLPPSAANPWFLSVKEGGYVNTKGRVNDFAITWFGPGGATTHAAPNPVTDTIEKQETVFWIPLPPSTSPNHAPVITAIAPQMVGEGLARSFVVTATDADGQELTYSALDLPAGATFTAATRTFAWTPSYTQAGSYVVRFVADDGAFPIAAADTEHVAITVVDRLPGQNSPPLFDPQSDRAAFVGEPVNFRVTARDPDETAPSYALLEAVAGASVDPASGLFGWTANQLGTTRFTFTATDPGGLSDTVVVNVVATDLVAGPAPPSPCSEDNEQLEGVVGPGNTVTTSETIIPFVARPGVQRIEAVLGWFGGPVVDLDLYLLDRDNNVVASAASVEPSEHLVYNTPQAGVYRWRVVGYASPDTAQFTIDMAQCATPGLVGIAPAPAGVTFAPASPNPFTTTTRIAFSLARRERVQLKLYNVAGRLVRTLENGELEAGAHMRLWDRRTDAGTTAGSGIYFARLVAGDRMLGQKIVLAH